MVSWCSCYIPIQVCSNPMQARKAGLTQLQHVGTQHLQAVATVQSPSQHLTTREESWGLTSLVVIQELSSCRVHCIVGVGSTTAGQ